MRIAPAAPSGPESVPLDLAAWNQALNRTHAMSGMRDRAGPLVRALESRRRDLVARRVLGGPHASVIDVGCEDGWMSQAWAAEVGRLVLVDVDPAALASARRRLGSSPRYAVADATNGRALERIPEAGRADVVVLSAILEHVPNPHGVLRSAGRLVAPGGRLIAYVPADGPILLAKAVLKGSRLGALVRGVSPDPAPGHLHRFDRRAFARLLRPHGRVTALTFDPLVLGYLAVLRPREGR